MGTGQWNNRIMNYAEARVADLLANPENRDISGRFGIIQGMKGPSGAANTLGAVDDVKGQTTWKWYHFPDVANAAATSTGNEPARSALHVAGRTPRSLALFRDVKRQSTPIPAHALPTEDTLSSNGKYTTRVLSVAPHSMPPYLQCVTIADRTKHGFVSVGADGIDLSTTATGKCGNTSQVITITGRGTAGRIADAIFAEKRSTPIAHANDSAEWNAATDGLRSTLQTTGSVSPCSAETAAKSFIAPLVRWAKDDHTLARGSAKQPSSQGSSASASLRVRSWLCAGMTPAAASADLMRLWRSTTSSRDVTAGATIQAISSRFVPTITRWLTVGLSLAILCGSDCLKRDPVASARTYKGGA
jgi:hypothetical protein